MKLLLDTHIFLWFISGDSRLAPSWRAAIQHPEHHISLSSVSVWECIVKYDLGKLPLPEPPHTYVPRQREAHQITSLVLDEASVMRLASLPRLHRDPFDRMLICQALHHNFTIMTLDAAIRAYPVVVLSDMPQDQSDEGMSAT